MKKFERIISIIMLAIISLSNVATPVAYAAQTGMIHFTLPSRSPVDASALTEVPHFLVADHASVLGASTSIFTIGTQKLDLGSGNAMSAQQRIPLQVNKLEKKVYETTEDVALTVVNPDNEAFTTSVTDSDGKSVAVPITESNNGTTTTVDLAPSNQIKPGLYKVTITDAEKKSTEQDFTWGVLALNLDKSMYHPKEVADIAMGVLNDNGDMVCDAKLVLRITNPELGMDDTLTTDTQGSAQIIVNPQCQKHDFSLQPDYEAHYTFGGAGVYSLQLTATTPNGTHTISDSVQVKDKIPFDLQRVSATRIYPPNTYPMLFNLTANQDFNGTVTESVPDSFTITPATQSAAQSYTDMQTVYLNSNDPAAAMSQQIASSSGGLVMPFHGSYPITQGFGAQLTDPTLQAFYTQYGLAGHDGIDFGVPMNTPLYAVDEGDVIWSGPGDYGTMVTIQHSWGETYYGHMTNTSVTVGQHVLKGQLIGYSGMSGEATGPHLHFGMKPKNPDMGNGYYGKIDPMPFLPIGQGESISMLGPQANPIATAVYNTTVLGASDSAATPTPSDAPSSTPTPTASVAPSAAPTAVPSPTAIPTAPAVSETPMQVSATPTPTNAPIPSVFNQSTTAENTSFSVLDKQIKISEEIANNALTQKVKILTWKVSLKKGESTTLGYAYQAPKVSPQFYLLGPAKFYAGGDDRLVFQEDRQWQIASDDVGVDWYTNTSKNPNNGYSWRYRKKIDISSSQVSVASPNGTQIGYSTVGASTDGGDNGNVSTTKFTTGPNSLSIVSMSVYIANPDATNKSLQLGIYTSTGTGSSARPNTLVLNSSTVTLAGGWNTVPLTTTLSANTTYWLGYFTNTTLSTTNNDVGDPSTQNVFCWDAATFPTWPTTWTTTGCGNNNMSIYATATPTVDFIDAGGDATEDTTTELKFWSGTGGNSATVDTTGGAAENGPAALKFTDSASGAYIDKTGILNDSGRRMSAYFKFDSSFPSSTHDIFCLDNTSICMLNLNVTSGGVLQVSTQTTQIGSNSSITLATGTWYRISMAYKITSSTNYSFNVYVNGTQVISYAQSSGGTTLAGTGTSDFFIGLSTPFGASDSIVEHVDDIYVDSGTDDSDPGNIHVTAKIPVGDGDQNSFSPGAGSTAAGPGCDAGATTHCQYVNERPLSITNFLSGPSSASQEYFTVQSAAQGDVNISGDNYIAQQAWVYMKQETTGCNPTVMYNNANTTTNTFSGTSYNMYTSIINTNVPPNQYNAVGTDTCQSSGPTLDLAEAGVQIAYEAPPAGNLANFPVLISLSSDSDLSKAQSSGNDIIFTDSTGRNLLPFEIENYNSGTLKAWVNISSLSSTSDTIIYMYYGNPAASANTTANAQSTWNSNYSAVWHFTGGTLPNTCGSTLGLNDSTSNGNTALQGNTGGGNLVTAVSGEICGGASFNGSSQYLKAADSTEFNPGSNPFSVTTWINESSASNEYTLFQHLNTTDNNTGWQLYLNGGGCYESGNGNLCIWDGANDLGSYGALTASTWQLVSYTRNQNTVTFYVNGNEVGTITAANGDGVQSTFPSGTGYSEYIGNDPAQASIYMGSMDEFEYSQTNLDPGWIQTEYNNQNAPGTFASEVGSVETAIDAPTLGQLMAHGDWFNNAGVKQPFAF